MDAMIARLSIKGVERATNIAYWINLLLFGSLVAQFFSRGWENLAYGITALVLLLAQAVVALLLRELQPLAFAYLLAFGHAIYIYSR